MKNVKQLIEERESQWARAEAIAQLANEENRELSDAEQAETREILGLGKQGEAGFLPGRIHKINDALDHAEKLEARTAALAAKRVPQGQQDGAPRAVIVPATARYRVGSLRAYRGERAEERAYTAGQFFGATMYRNERAAGWCRDHGIDVRFQASLGEGSDSAGGFLVPTEIEQTIIDLREEFGVFRQTAQVVPMARDTKTQPVRKSGVTAYFVGEHEEITASDKAWGQVELTARKLAALVRYSNELSEDSVISIGDELTREIAYAFSVKEDACGFLGDGTSSYGHMTGVLNAVAAGSIYTAITGNTAFSTLDLADFEAMIGQLPRYPGIKPAWYISQAGWSAAMLRLCDAGAGNTAAMIQEGANGNMKFLGFPVVITQTLNSTLTAQTSTKLLCFGDLRMAAILGNRRGLAIALSGERFFEYDQIGIRGIERFDINVHSRGTANTAGAILVLATPGS